MLDSATTTNISEFLGKNVTEEIKKISNRLKAGELHAFEVELHKLLGTAYNYVCEQVLPVVAEELKEQLKLESSSQGNRRIKPRDSIVRISTGHLIKLPSLYIGKPKEVRADNRHLIDAHWNIIGGASPLLYDRVGYCSAISPSYDTGHQTLSKFGVKICLSSVRDITNRLANYCNKLGEEHLIIKKNETVSGKRVVLSIDGGRTRLREYTEEVNEKGNSTYDTAWCEPKLFVIDILDDEGNAAREELPIYGVRYLEEDFFELLKRYLRKIKIGAAKQVQIIADGATWIWNNAKELLEELGVATEKIVETLDVYHATKYVNELVDNMPQRITSAERKNYLTVFKEALWKGNANTITATCREIYKQQNDTVRRAINYLDKHLDKMQYADFQDNKLMCGSGIVESAIRRVINLRFKNASTFWNKEIVEKLYFFRAAVLSGRWDTVIHNINNGH
jgi:hypothetical protein